MTTPVREWATFQDPVDGFRWDVDVTFLTSRWRCLFGCGCQGVLTETAPELEQGCCSYGAHTTGDADRARVEEAAGTLTADEWQFAARGGRRGAFVRSSGGGWRTRLVDGACIFLNRPGFAQGPGCALHLAATRSGQDPMVLKPDVCWQLPLRRSYRAEDDGSTTSVLSEFGRRGWGEGGDAFAWWCTEAPEAFSGGAPVYRSMEPEIRAMVGDALYERIAGYLDRRRHGDSVPVPHPAVRTRDGSTSSSRMAREPVPATCSSTRRSSSEAGP